MKLLKDMCSLYKITMNYIILGKSTKKRTKIINKRRGEIPPPFFKTKRVSTLWTPLRKVEFRK